MAKYDLNDIAFCEADEATVKAEVIGQYETITGRTLADGDPVRLFLLSIADELVIQRNLINFTGCANLLAYATGDYLDHLGILLDVIRIPASAAETTITFSLSTDTVGVVIPKGTRVTTKNESAYFATDEELSIAAGETSGTVSASCIETGTAGNGIGIGELTKLVDPVAYVSTVTNTTVTAGGADVEDDESYRERIREAPEKFSNAGSYGAYEYWAKTAAADIADVYVTSPTPGEVNIYPLLDGGKIPEQEVLDKVYDVCNADKVRPLTDKVSVLAPGSTKYDIDVAYKIAKDDSAKASAIQAAVNAAVSEFALWQKSKLGRDLDPSKLVNLMVAAGAKKVTVTAPVITVIDNASIVEAETVSVKYQGVDDE
jgi:phage-related baseplate assembly protein